jgi:hypothetical protein
MEKESKLTPAQIEAGIAYLREFMGDEWPATILDSRTMIEGVWEAIHAQRLESSDKTPSNPRARP